MTQVPPSASTRSWWRRISSISSVMLKANISFLPVRSAARSIARITARTRSSNGQAGPSPCSSSSLMKSMPASASSATSAAVAVGVEADARLDDGADQRPALDAGEPAGAVDAELRAGVGGGEGGRQAEIEQPEAGELLQLEEVAGDGRDEVRQRRAHVVERPGERDPARRGAARPGGRRRAARGRRPAPRSSSAHDAGGGALLELGGLAGDGQEGAGGLLAGHRLGGLGERPGGLDPVVGFDAAHAAASGDEGGEVDGLARAGRSGCRRA